MAFKMAVEVVALRTSGAPAPAVLRPRKDAVAIFAIFARVTALLAMVAAKEPVPEPVTSPVRVMVWSPVLVPLRLLPVTVPDAATLVGVIAPRVREIAGVVVAVATEPLTPFAVVTDTLVTVPLPPPDTSAVAAVPMAEATTPEPVKSSEVAPAVTVTPSSLMASGVPPPGG
jgi:hypothetical protein